MDLFNNLFGSTESIAKEAQLDNKSILKIWKDYLKTIPKKKLVINRLDINKNLQKNLQELKELLKLELVDILNEEIEEKELIADLESMEHKEKIKRVYKLENCLRYVETKYEYVYNLLHQLHSILKSQMHLTEKLLAGSRKVKKLISHIKLQLELELEIIKKIEEIKTFHNLFSALVKGEHIIRTMDLKEKKLLKKMQKGMNKIFSAETPKEIDNQKKWEDYLATKGITYRWAMTVFEAIEDKVHEGVANGMFECYHPDIDFEFVNRPEFVNLVRETIQKLKKKKVSEQMINVFVHLFREWYNHERD